LFAILFVKGKSRFLFLALSAKGYGETILGIRVARELHKLGHHIAFLVHDSAAQLVTGEGFPNYSVASHSVSLISLHIQNAIEQCRPSAIVLSDLFTTLVALEQGGVGIDWLKRTKYPLVALDTWDSRRTGWVVDICGRPLPVIEGLEDVGCQRISPVPITFPEGGLRQYHYSSLPQPYLMTKKQRTHIRTGLGIGSQHKAIVFCTAEWQHAKVRRNEALRKIVPPLITRYIKNVGNSVHLIHVGPQKLQVDLSERYHWFPPMPSPELGQLIASADLFLSLNLSATTVAASIASMIPVMTLCNSFKLSSARDAEAIPGLETNLDLLRKYAGKSQVMWPFYLWPLGYRKFLTPIIDRTEYASVVNLREMFDADEVTARLTELLVEGKERSAALEMQAQYRANVMRLPNPAAVIRRLEIA
jgi:hypothetical protein